MVKAIGAAGDQGWFGPDSAAWQVNGSLATLVGGPRALLLQACHPLALAGVEQHSTYRTDPLGRLQRTNLYVTTSTFGSSSQAEQTAAMVRGVHQRVSRHRTRRPFVLGAGPAATALGAHRANRLDARRLPAVRTWNGGRRPVRRGDGPACATTRRRGSADHCRRVGRGLRLVPGRDRRRAGRQGRRALPALPRSRAAGRSLGAPYEILVRAATDLLPHWAHDALGTRPPQAVSDREGRQCRVRDNAAIASDCARTAFPRRRAGLPQGRRRPRPPKGLAGGLDDDQARLGHLADRVGRALAGVAGVADAAVGHLVGAPGGHLVDEHAAEVERAGRLERGRRRRG